MKKISLAGIIVAAGLGFHLSASAYPAAQHGLRGLSNFADYGLGSLAMPLESDLPSAEKMGQAKTADDARRDLVAAAVSAAQASYKVGNYTQALAKLQEADALPGKGVDELFLVERTRIVIALTTKDEQLLGKSAEAIVATGKESPAEQLKFIEVVARFYYNQKQYPQAVTWINRYVKEGGAAPNWRKPLLHAYYFSNDFAHAAQEVLADIQTEEAAGRTPSEEQLKLLVNSTLQMKDPAAHQAAIEKYLTYYPKPEYWADLLDKVLAKPGISDSLTLDVYYLMQAIGQPSTAEEYVGMAQLALNTRSAAEAKKIVDQGFASGVLGVGADAGAHKQLRDKIAKSAAGEVKIMEKDLAAAQKAKDASGLAILGQAYVNHGMVEKGIGLMEQSVRIGGLRRSGEARLHLGLAYMQNGRKENAIQAFRSVQGNDGAAELARYWVLHLNSVKL